MHSAKFYDEKTKCKYVVNKFGFEIIVLEMSMNVFQSNCCGI